MTERPDAEEHPSDGNSKDLTTDPTLSRDGQAGSSGGSLPAGVPGRIGSYVIKRVIASGGMGTVFEALQENPRRPVAVKVIKEPLASDGAIERLEYEAQILARLRHPGIAQIYEAGSFEDRGSRVPFFAMEYIPNARPITAYAVDKRLDHRQRLELFLQVCDAVHHGHQRGIVHRDLKPSNILVDSSGRVRIIDFGVARATDSDTKRAGVHTEYGSLVGSVMYMSPEQFEADPHDIDTRSDVYTLGVVLYELLAGRLPYQTTFASVFDIANAVRNGSRQPLSSHLPELSGDAEAIVHKAMERDRERRYQSAHGLALDISRFLAGDAVAAHTPGFSYQLRIFARRNRALIGGIAAVFILMAAATIVTTSLLFRVDAERERAEIESSKATAGRQFLTEVLSSTIPPGGYGATATITDVLDSAGEKIDSAFPDEPEIEAEIRRSLGRGYMTASEWTKSRRHLEAALELRRQALGPTHDDTLQSMLDLKRLYEITDSRRKSLELMRDFETALAQRLGNEHDDVLSARSNLAYELEANGEISAALATGRDSLDAYRRIKGDSDAATLDEQARYAWLLMRSGDFEEAERLARDAFDRSTDLHGRTHWATQNARSALAAVYVSLGKIDAAKEIYGHRGLPKDFTIEHEFQGSFDPESSPFQLLVFFEAWCPFSQKAMPGLTSIHREYNSAGLQVVGITQVSQNATEEMVEELLTDSEVSFPAVKESGDLWNHFGCDGVPSLRLLHDGTLIWEHINLSVDRLAPSMLEGIVATSESQDRS